MDSTTGTEAHNIVDDTTPSNSASAASAKAATASIESITVFGEAGVEFGETTTTVRSAPTYNTADGISSSTAQSRHIVFEPTPSNNFLTVSQTIVPGRLQTNQELSFESNKDTDGGDFLQSRKIIGQRKAGILPNFDSLTKEETSTNYGRPTEQSVGTTTSLHHFLMTNEPEERGEGSSEEFDVADSDTRMETGSTQDIRMPSDSTPDTRIDTGSSPKGFIREHSTWMISDLIPTEGAIHYPALSAEISTTALNVQIQTPRYNQNEDGDWAMFEHIPAENDLPPSQLNAKVVESGADFDVSLNKEVVPMIENTSDRNKLTDLPNYSSKQRPEMRTVTISDDKDLQLDTLTSKTVDDDEIGQESHSVSSRNSESNVETPVTLTTRMLHTSTSHGKRKSSTVYESPRDEYFITREPGKVPCQRYKHENWPE